MVDRFFLLFVFSRKYTANADTISSYLNDEFNADLVGSDLGPSSFSDDWEIANNVALNEFNLATASIVNFVSSGFLVGGIDPYLTVFHMNYSG